MGINEQLTPRSTTRRSPPSLTLHGWDGHTLVRRLAELHHICSRPPPCTWSQKFPPVHPSTCRSIPACHTQSMSPIWWPGCAPDLNWSYFCTKRSRCISEPAAVCRRATTALLWASMEVIRAPWTLTFTCPRNRRPRRMVERIEHHHACIVAVQFAAKACLPAAHIPSS
jgi:hypothetical protein